MNEQKRLINACRIVSESSVEWTHTLAKNLDYFTSPFRGKGGAYRLGDRVLSWVIDESNGDIEKLSIQLLNVDSGFRLPLWEYRKGQEGESTWLYEGPWCDLFASFVAEVEAVIEQEREAFEKTFRLPSVLE